MRAIRRRDEFDAGRLGHHLHEVANLDAAVGAVDRLEAGKAVDSATLPQPLQPLFNPAVQPFLRDLMAQDPARLAASLAAAALCACRVHQRWRLRRSEYQMGTGMAIPA